MKTITKSLFALSALTIAGVVLVQNFSSLPTYKARAEKEEKLGNSEYQQEIQGAIDYNIKLRRNVLTGVVESKDIYETKAEVSKALAMKASGVNNLGLNWSEMGPDNIGGRTLAILIDKNNSNKMFAGGVSGGLWVSTNGGGSWSAAPGCDQLSNIAVSCITQAANGDIYFGTGESFYYPSGNGAGGGIAGGGVYKSTDGGNSFFLLPSTKPAADLNSGPALICQMAASPTDPNKIYLAADNGLLMTYDGGTTWYPVLKGNLKTLRAEDVDVASDGTVVAVIQGGTTKPYLSTTGDTGSFTPISGGLLFSNVLRMEIAIAPSDPNFMYASLASAAPSTFGLLAGIYLTVNKGKSWKLIGPGGTKQFEPFASGGQGQGGYDNAIAVSPFDKTFVLLGGVNLYKWKGLSSTDTSGVGQWSQLDSQFNNPNNSYYVHPDKHTVKFHPTNKNNVFIGCDGGVFRSSNILSTAPTFSPLNKGYDVTQFYSVAFSALSNSSFPGVLGGTQDNGTLFNLGTGTTKRGFDAVDGGDGGECQISQLKDFLYTTVYYGSLSRNGGPIYNTKVAALKNGSAGVGSPGFASFVTPVKLFETTQSVASYDSVTFVAGQDYSAGDKINLLSKRGSLYFEYVLPNAVNNGDVIRVPDLVQSRLAVGFAGVNGVYMTTDAFGSSGSSNWFHVGRLGGGEVEALAWSNDGDVLYFGTEGGQLYRITNMLAAVDSLSADTASNKRVIHQQQIGGFGQMITDIAIDPNNDNNILVTLANYGSPDHVYLNTNAKTTPKSAGKNNFTSLQGTGSQKLPAMPVYGAVFVKSQPNTVALATEYGVWASTDITQPASSIVWEQETNGQLPQVPCFAIHQQTIDPWNCLNSGTIYVGTHGRGIWKCENYFSPQTSVKENSKFNPSLVSIFPNPAVSQATVEFAVNRRTNLTMNIFDMSGKLVKSEVMNNVQEGKQHLIIDSSSLSSGTYLLCLKGDDINSAKRFVVSK